MLILYDVNHNKTAALQNAKEIKLERELTGVETLSFSYPQSDSKYYSILEECYIRTIDNEYIVKEINDDTDWTEYVCKVNTEDLSGNNFDTFESLEQSCTDAVNLILVGTGWTIGECNVSKKRTVRKAKTNSYELLTQVQSTYLCEMKFDAINKKVYIYEQMGSDKGAYFLNQLNLRKLSTQRNSYDFYTRIIPIGSNGLTIADVNNGVNYLENHQYSDKNITYYWGDSRYTNATDLKADATLKLADMSKPYRAYKADIVDLAKFNAKYTNILDFDLGDTITLIDKTKNIKEKQRIVKITEYQLEPEKNEVEIANITLRFDDMQAKLQESSDTVESVTDSTGQVLGYKIDSIDANKVLNLTTANIQDFSAVNGRIGTLETTKASITDLNTANANIANLTTNKANVTDLTAATGRISTIEANYVLTTQLNSANANISTLQSNVASINNVLAGNVGASNIQAGAIQAGSSIIATGAIGSAQISDLSASKLTAGIIDASVITVKNLTADNITAGTINGQRIADGAIDNSKVSNTANIDGSKLNISSVVTAINGNSTNIQASKIALSGSTLDVQFSNINQTVSSQGQTISSQASQISANANAIATKVTQTDVDTSINAIKVGCRNLILNSKDISKYSIEYGVTVTQADDYYKIYRTIAQIGKWGVYKDIAVLPNTTYTFSFKARNVNGGSICVGSFVSGQSNWYGYANTVVTANSLAEVTFTTFDTETKIRVYIATTSSTSSIDNYMEIKEPKLEIGNKPTDWTPAPEDIQSQIDNTNGNVTSLTTRVSSAESSITQNANSIALKLDSQTFTSYKSTNDSNISTINNSLSTQSSSITAMQGQIATKVTQTDINNSINAIQVGGRNLLKNTKDIQTFYNIYGYGGSDAGSPSRTIENDYYKVLVVNATRTNNYHWIQNGLPDLIKGNTYTFSMDVKTNNANALLNFFVNYTADVKTISIPNTGEQWQRISATCTINNAVSGSVLYDTYFNVPAIGDYICYKNIKVELGNKPTDWTPAPEDVQGQIDSATTRITNNETSITQLNSSITLKANQSSLDTTNSNVSGLTTRMSNAESSLSVQAGQIATKVTQTDINNSINAIQVGGRNLMSNTKTLSSTIYPSRITANTYLGFAVAKGVFSSPYVDTLEQCTINIPNKSLYTVSFYAKADVPQDITCYFYNPNTTTKAISSTGQSSTSSDGMCGVSVTTSWQKYWVTWTQTATSGVKHLLIGRVFSGNVYICGIKLEEGNKATDWTPAPEDIQNQIDSATSAITQNANSIATKVSQNGVISAINQTAESVTIQANKIGLLGETNIPNLHADKIYGGVLTLGGSGNANGEFKINNSSNQTVIDGGKDSNGLYNFSSIDPGSGTVRAKFGEYISGRHGVAIYNQYGEMVTSSDMPPAKSTNGVGVAGCYITLTNVEDARSCLTSISSVAVSQLNNLYIGSITVASISGYAVGDWIALASTRASDGTSAITTVMISGISGNTITLDLTTWGGVNPFATSTYCYCVKIWRPNITVNISAGFIVTSDGRYIKVNAQSKTIKGGMSSTGDVDGFAWEVCYIDNNGALQVSEQGTSGSYYGATMLGGEIQLQLNALPNTSVGGTVVGAILTGMPCGANPNHPHTYWVHQIFHDPAIRQQMPNYVNSSNKLCSSNVDYAQWEGWCNVPANGTYTLIIPIGENKKSAIFALNTTGSITSNGFYGIAGRYNFTPPWPNLQNTFGISPSYVYEGGLGTPPGDMTYSGDISGGISLSYAYITDSSSGQNLKIILHNSSSAAQNVPIYVNIHAF